MDPLPPKKNKSKRILIVEEHPIVREGISSLISRQKDMDVCAEASGPQDAKRLVIESRPDLVVLELFFGGGDGLHFLKELKGLGLAAKLLVLSVGKEDTYAERVIKAGGDGYVMKHEPTETLLTAIRSTLEGKIYLSSRISLKVLSGSLRHQNWGKTSFDRLTDRELSVFQLIGLGMPNRKIAVRLNISIKTVETHRENIKAKLGLENSVALVQEATLWIDKQRIS